MTDKGLNTSPHPLDVQQSGFAHEPNSSSLSYNYSVWESK